MSLRNFLALNLCCVLSFLTVPFSYAGSHVGGQAGIQDLNDLRVRILSHSQSHFEHKYQKQFEPENIHITVGKLDSRLRLAQCDNFLTFDIREATHNSSSATTKVQCDSSAPWSIYVPIKISLYGEILVANKNLPRGTLLTDQDLELSLVNISTARNGYILNPERAVGKEAKRAIRAGDIIRLSNLKLPNVVERGQEVTVESRNALLSVQTSAVAMASGHVGQRIKVKNTKSNRVLSATIVAPGMVSVSAR